MPARRFKRGDYVRYDGSLERFRGTWWTVDEVVTDRRNRLHGYTLTADGIGRLRHVQPGHVSQPARD
ncbi:hypothetical protein ACFYOY_13520 [Streptomyces sp. NPDC007875]|uniref:hypothetical protein n=1 Tax=Streptomyces sp. NPDC007875 TaxID=3364783 RepID=UPI0036926D9E